MKSIFLSAYVSQVNKLLIPDEGKEMENEIIANALAYPVIAGSGGFRKARGARGSSGKSGGVRAIFYYLISAQEIYFAMVYAKSNQENISDDEKKRLKKLARRIEEGDFR